jgi:1-aminocyclopropane-1-carboxylate deaminase
MFDFQLEFNPKNCISIDLKKFGIEASNFYIYLDNYDNPKISGNKTRKLYGSIMYCRENQIKNILTIGGNYSNHLYAASHIPKLFDINVIAIVKGSAPKEYGYTLKSLQKNNIPIHFIDKNKLKEQKNELLESILNSYENVFFIEEGGSNSFAHLGYKELINGFQNSNFEIISTAAGTGGTAESISKYFDKDLRIYAALNDYELKNKFNNINNNHLIFDYNFGGYAKVNPSYLAFLDQFYSEYKIWLDPIYTGKMIYGIIEDYKKGFIDINKKHIAIHSGGLQGWYGIAERYPNLIKNLKNKPI